MAGNVGGYQAGGGGVSFAASQVVSGMVTSGDLGAAVVFSGNIASGQVAWAHLSSGAVRSGHIANTAVNSGNVSSGSLFGLHFASGATADYGRGLVADTFTTTEIISGASIAVGVAFNQSGLLQTAMAAVSGRMPSIGVVVDNVASGAVATVYQAGHLRSPAFSFSGWMNQLVYIGRSGQLSASGAPTLSGDIQQTVGVSTSQSGLFIQIGDALEGVAAGSGDVGSGAVTGQAGGGYFCVASGTLTTNDLGSGAITSGLISSGVIGRFHVASGQFAGFELGSGAIVSGRIASGVVGYGHLADNSVQSGKVTSGTVIGSLGGGPFMIASGTVGPNDLASGSVISGNIASGVVGFGHLANASVRSGTIASGIIFDFHFTSGAKISRANQVIDEYTTEETVSGFKAVSVNSGNNIVLAMAGSGLRLPVVGIVASNYASGQLAVLTLLGKAMCPVVDLDASWSGKAGQHLYCGSGGHILAQSLLVSGQGWQKLGVAVSGGMIVNIDLTILSGGYTTPPGLF